MNRVLHKAFTGAVAALSLGAMVAATSTPASAYWRGHGGGWGRGGWGGGGVAAGVIGGLALGALAAGAYRPAYGYAAPVYGDPGPYYPAAGYAEPGYYPVCHKEWRPVYRADGYYLRDRLVRVCN